MFLSGGLHPENGVEFGYCAMCVSSNPLGHSFIAPPLKIVAGLDVEKEKEKEEEVDERLEVTDSEGEENEEEAQEVPGMYVRNAGEGFLNDVVISGLPLSFYNFKLLLILTLK